MKKLFNYIFASILLVSSVIALGHFIRPERKQSISADAKYQNLSSADVYLSRVNYTINSDTKLNIGTAYEEGIVAETHANKDLPCYTIVGIKESAYEKVMANPYISLPTLVSTSGKVSGYIVGIGFYNTAHDSVNGFAPSTSRGAFQCISEIDGEGKSFYIADTEINSYIKGIAIPKIYKYISYSAFFANTTIEEIRFESHNNLINLGNSTFANTTNLKSVSTYRDGELFKNSSLPISINQIPSQSFNNSGLETFTIYNGVSVLEGAFSGCKNLKNVNFSVSSSPLLVSEDDPITIQNDAFASCESLSSINMPYGTTTIGRKAFKNCYGLKLIEIPETVVSIGYDAFYLDNYVVGEDNIDKNLSAVKNSRSIILKGNHDTISLQYPFKDNLSFDFAPAFGSENNTMCTSLFIESNNESYQNTITNKINSLDPSHTYYVVVGTKNDISLYVQDPVSGNDVQYDPTRGAGASVKTSYYPQEAITLLHTPVVSGLTVKVDGEDIPLDLTGYVFDGWYINGNPALKVENGVKANYGGWEIVAMYKLQEFDFNVVDGSSVSTYTSKYGETIGDVLLQNYNEDKLDPEALDFVGFYSDAPLTTLLDKSKTITSNTTVYFGRKSLGEIFDLTFDKTANSYTINSVKFNNITRVYIPKTYNNVNITKLSANLFIGNKTLEYVFFDLNSEVVEIGNYAFQGCNNLKYFEIPSKCSDNFNTKHIVDNTPNLTKVVILGSIIEGSRTSAPILPSLSNPNAKVYIAYNDSSVDAYSNSVYKTANTISVAIYHNPIGTVANTAPSISANSTVFVLFPNHFFTLEEQEITGHHFTGWGVYNSDFINSKNQSLTSKTYTYDDVNNVKYLNASNECNYTLLIKANYICKFSTEVINLDTDYFSIVTGWNQDYVDIYKGSTALADIPRYVLDNNGITRPVTQIANLGVEKDNDDTKISGNINKVLIHNNIISILNGAFINLESLNTVEFEKSSVLKDIGDKAFQNTGITSFVCDTTNLNRLTSYSFADTKKMKVFSLPNAPIQLIQDGVFINSGITSFEFPVSLAKIDGAAFNNTKNLTQVVIPENSALWYIGESAFEESAISSIQLENVNYDLCINSRAFAKTSNLKSINLSVKDANTLTMYDYVFYDSGLVSLTLPSNVEFVSDIRSALLGANLIESIIVEETGIKKIYDHEIDKVGHDNIIYSISGDDMIIEYIPTNYRGALKINSKVKTLKYTDELFRYLPYVQSITASYEDDYNYFVKDNCIYLLDKNTMQDATLLFVSNSIKDNRFVVPASITTTIEKDIYIVNNIEKYALNSNEHIRILSFDKEFVPTNMNGISAIDNIHSNVEVVEISSKIDYITEDNFVNFKNLKTIRVLNEAKDRESKTLIQLYNTTLDKAFNTIPMFIVPDTEKNIYATLSGWEDVVVDSKITINFVTNGGAEMSAIRVDFDSVPNLQTPIKTGYDFINWYIDEELTIPYSSQGTLSNLTLYAGYNVHEYTYTYMVGDEVFYTQKVPYDSLPSGPDKTPTMKGKVFVKWTTKDGVEYDLTKSKASSDVVLFAEFETDSKFVMKIILICAAVLVVVIVVTTIIIKSVRKKRAKKNY